MKMLQRRLVDWIEHRTGLESAVKNLEPPLSVVSG